MRISKAIGWTVFKTPEYEVQTNNFRRAAETIIKKAKAKNIDGATLGLCGHDGHLRALPSALPRSSQHWFHADRRLMRGYEAISTISRFDFLQPIFVDQSV